ncbi:hypothetical protein IAR55_001576 [Kwoniella newhampshirensis]|uniref:Uncharacterized protein n=1 Tax=Kwoniella newhampshirensis TaxID=1651941 RepID=A0AAW0Z2R0_9TREE
MDCFVTAKAPVLKIDLLTKDFSSANVPISRDTWAPRSPSPQRPSYAADPYAERPPPSRDDLDERRSPPPRAPGSANGAGNGSNDGYRGERDAR